MKGITYAIVVGAFVVCAIIALAPVMGIAVPQTIWGMVIGTIASLVGTLIPSSREKFEIVIPANYSADIKIEIRERR